MVGPHRHRRAARRDGDDAAAPPVLDDEVDREPALEDGVGRRPGGRDERPLDLGPGRRAAGVDDAGPGVAALAGQGQRPGRLAVELGPQGDQLAHPAGPLVDQHADRVDVAQPGPGGQRVGQMEVGRVLVAAEDRGHAALGPPGGGLCQLALGQDPDVPPSPVAPAGQAAPGAPAGQANGGRQTGHAAAEDEDVERPGSRRRGPGGHVGVIAVSSASRRAAASSICRLARSTWTTTGAYDSSSSGA